MTHAEALALPGRPPGIDQSDCPGTLVLTEPGISDGQPPPGKPWSVATTPRVVRVYRCDGCGMQVAMTGQVVLNAYVPGSPRDLIGQLAESLRAPCAPEVLNL